jgi:hypothetical protein
MKDRRRTTHRKSQSKPMSTSKRSKTKTNKLSKSPMKQDSPPAKNITRTVIPDIPYPRVEDTHDGIVFLLGHSEFKGKLCHLSTLPGMKQSTLLVAKVGTPCMWITHPKKFEALIRARFSDALSYLPKHIEDFTFTVKSFLKKMPFFSKQMEDNKDVKEYFESRGDFSTSPDEYCERRWEFYVQDPAKWLKLSQERREGKPVSTTEGRVMLLRRDEKGEPFFEVLYKKEIDRGDFVLTKTRLYEKLYGAPYHLRNVLLVDFGCAELKGVDEEDLEKLRSGQFGGRG